MNKSEILGAFNNHFIEFFNEVSLLFPENTDIKIAHTSLTAMRKANPKLIATIWKQYIVEPYKNEIEAGNISFFINRNYTEDLKDASYAQTILQKIDTLREPIKQMGEENLKKTIGYVQNLTKICELLNE